jgi:hypothetical protein
MRANQWLFAAVFANAVALLCATGGCSSKGGGSGFDTLGTGSSGGGGAGSDSGGGASSGGQGSGDGGGLCLSCVEGGGGPPPSPCTGGGLTCHVPTCPSGGTTSISGTVYDPAGTNPLYNVVVFIPNDPTGKVAPIKTGTNSCQTCDVSIGDYVAVATTNAKGQFKLTGVPAGTQIPIVVQTGKWRRRTFINTVAACQDNPQPKGALRLPRSRAEGDLPQMLLLTGGCDDLGCFMRSMGIDASEFSAPHGGGRLDIYQGSGLVGSGATLSSGTAGTWGGLTTKQAYEYYDIAIFSCECAEHMDTTAGRQALHDWLGEGGKVFASHYHYTWFSQGPADFQGVANWKGTSVAAGSGNYTLDTLFPKGMVMQQWLANVGAASGSTIALSSVADSVSTVNPPTTRWIYDQAASSDVKYLSFLTPIGGIPGSAATDGGASDGGAAGEGPKYCGKAVFTDLHTSSGLLASAASIPQDCSGAALTAQQDALEFLFFDLSACVAPDTIVPPPPPPPRPLQ